MVDIDLINNSELARRIGVSVVYIHYVLSGMRKNERRCAQIAKELGMDIKSLKRQILKRKSLIRHNGKKVFPPSHKINHENGKTDWHAMLNRRRAALPSINKLKISNSKNNYKI